MKRVSLALCSLVAALTLPAYAADGQRAASAASAPGAGSAPRAPSAGSGAPAPSARPPAEQPLTAEVLIIHATHEKKGVDPRIGPLPELGKAPFDNYDSYLLLERTRLPLKKDGENLKLPNKRTLQVRLLEEPGHDSVRMSASINRPDGKDFLKLLEVKAHVGQRFIVAGQNHKNGILVLVIRVVK
ncbi:MAG TPA: hypothetical protein VFK05_02375 [Polyangiaceae bacterium]|nr:hypothetical protein [Polyangiaceae bacterium]